MNGPRNSAPAGRTLHVDVDANGIALITLDDASRPMNVVSPEFMDDMIAAIERIAGDPAVRGAVITSAKPAFMAGADLKYIVTLTGGAISSSAAFAFSQRPSMEMHRRLETCGKPFVAAINGLALGGGYELCLACHHRVMADVPGAVVGLPEVTVGLLPGSGGTQRLARMIGVEASLPFLVDGKIVGPAEALAAGLVDAVVPPGELIQAARNWLLAKPDAVRAWDKKGYKTPGGLLNPAIATVMSMRVAAVSSRTSHNYPAPIAILDCVFEGTMMPFDKALRLESKYFAKLLCDPVARNLIRTSFLHKAEAGKLARRLANVPTLRVKKLGVLGAGMMGAGIALVAASAGIEVVLLDREIAVAEKGRGHSVNALAKDVQRGKRTAAQADAIVARITVTVDHTHLQGCDLVVEAVFEDVAIKADATRKAEAAMPVQAIMASNTSTLPISELAAASGRPGQFIGLHFFSPVERMPLVEIIVGRQTTQTTLANALDFVAQLKMTPIVVNDSRGFYTSRVFQTFIHEGMLLLEEGVLPALIENAARLAGMPLGPLALLDEVTIELPWKIVQESAAALGDKFTRPAAYEVMRRMLEELKRPGKRYGKGFYEYPEGGKKRLWPGLEQAFPPALAQPSLAQVKTRLLYIQALETARCLEEGVLTHPADADVGSLLAWGFPAWTGGPLSLIETVGIREFVATCDELAASAGPRYAPSNALRDRARRGAGFYAS
jgi:3-hydroxyacyl-CoA dehydrogenase/enoyl-CoA hydratase/3-hydroxybutyryl-CoA epimerase